MKNVKQISGRWAGIMGMICLLATTLTSCLKNDNTVTPQQPVALLSVINASPDSQPLYFSLDGNIANTSPFSYGSGLDYFRAVAGRRKAAFTGTGSVVVKADSVTLVENRSYSLYVANNVATPDLLLLADTINRPDVGKATVRFVNVSPDAAAVDLVIKDGATITANKAYKGFSSFTPLDGKKYTFEVRQSGTTTVLAALDGVALNSGSVYTLWLQGFKASTDTKKLTLKVQNNAYFY
jgi:hypothetical protein